MLTEVRKRIGIFAVGDGDENHLLSFNQEGERADLGQVPIDADDGANDRARGLRARRARMRKRQNSRSLELASEPHAGVRRSCSIWSHRFSSLAHLNHVMAMYRPKQQRAAELHDQPGDGLVFDRGQPEGEGGVTVGGIDRNLAEREEAGREWSAGSSSGTGTPSASGGRSRGTSVERDTTGIHIKIPERNKKEWIRKCASSLRSDSATASGQWLATIPTLNMRKSRAGSP